jgi:hypothetical protein
VLAIVVGAAVVSLVAVVFELIAAKAAGPHRMLPHLAFGAFTVLGTWLLLPTLFGLTYASEYYGPEPDRGLAFPDAEPGFEPDHNDFLYFSFTIAVTAQTSDVGVTTRAMRRLVLFQSILSFVFNTTILAVLGQRRGELLLTGALQRREQLRLAARLDDTAVAPLERALDEPADRARIDHVLLYEHARSERLLAVVGEHGNDRLRDDRPVIEVGGDEVDGRAARLAAGVERTPVRVQPRKRGQQRRDGR